MNKFPFLLITILLSNASLQAILPPLYQNIAEIEAIFKDPHLTDYLSSADVIKRIEKNDDVYEITTNKHHLSASIKFLPQTQPGPAKFKVEFKYIQE